VSPRSGHRIPTLQRYYMVAIFTLTASLLYADQNLMAPNLSLIAEEFGFNEEEKTKYARFRILCGKIILLGLWVCLSRPISQAAGILQITIQHSRDPGGLLSAQVEADGCLLAGT
jgi:hypothetical protein